MLLQAELNFDAILFIFFQNEQAGLTFSDRKRQTGYFETRKLKNAKSVSVSMSNDLSCGIG